MLHTIIKIEHSAYFPTDDIFLNFGDLLLTQNRI